MNIHGECLNTNYFTIFYWEFFFFGILLSISALGLIFLIMDVLFILYLDFFSGIRFVVTKHIYTNIYIYRHQ